MSDQLESLLGGVADTETKARIIEQMRGADKLAQKLIDLAGAEKVTVGQMCLAIQNIVRTLEKNSPADWALAGSIVGLLNSKGPTND